jgi:nucleoid DNA-binding protein
LIPTKHSFLFPEIADENEVSVNLVKEFVTFYWKEIRKKLSNAEGPNIIVHGLGTFRVKPWKVPEVMLEYENTIKKYKKIIDSGDRISFQKFAILKDNENRLKQLQNLQSMLQEDHQKKKKIKEKRNAK